MSYHILLFNLSVSHLREYITYYTHNCRIVNTPKTDSTFWLLYAKTGM